MPYPDALLPGMGRPVSILHDDIETVLINEQQITAALDVLGREIVEGFDGQEFTAVAVLKGAAVFVSDLIRRIPVPLELAFVMATSYRKGTTAGQLDLDFFPNDAEIEGRRMLLVDDILDTGKTMFTLKAALLARGAADVKTAVFLDKPARRSVEFQVDYRCFEIEDKFVVGYGLDFAGRYRNLPYVGALKPAIFEAVLGKQS